MSAVDATLAERGQRYGEFPQHAHITQCLKDVMRCTDVWVRLEPDQKEALEMVAHKIGRILNGDPNYIDSWHDICGYVRLVEQRLEKEFTAPVPEPKRAIELTAYEAHLMAFGNYSDADVLARRERIAEDGQGA